MEIVINACYGGFGLSPFATKELAKRKGKECYFFKYSLTEKTYTPISIEKAEESLIWCAYSVHDPQNYRLSERDDDGSYKSANERAAKILLDDYDNNRTDTDLIAVVKKFGEKVNSKLSKLKVVEIPDDVEWKIDDYDGFEHIAEKHRTWH